MSEGECQHWVWNNRINSRVVGNPEAVTPPSLGSELSIIQERAARGWLYITRIHVTLVRTVRDRGIRTGSPSTDMMCRPRDGQIDLLYGDEVLLRRGKGLCPAPILIETVTNQVGHGSPLNESAKL